MQKLNRSRIIALEQLLKLSYRSFDSTSKYEICFYYIIFIFIFDSTSKYRIYFYYIIFLYLYLTSPRNIKYILIYIYICIFIFDSTSNPFPLRVFPLLPLDQVGLGENDQPKRLTVHLR